MSPLTWVAAGNGRLALWGRPGRRVFKVLRASGCDRVVTLLSESEGGRDVGSAVSELGLHWTWLPLPNGQPPVGDDEERLRAALPVLAGYLAGGESILIHCAAGIHRTGLVAYALLHLLGYEEDAALDCLGRLRAHTRAGLLPKHIAWGSRGLCELASRSHDDADDRGT